MEHSVIVLVLTLMVIAAAAAVAPKLRVPAQLIRVLAGLRVSVILSK